MKYLSIVFSFLMFTSFAQNELNWNMFHPVNIKWQPFGVTGSIQEALINAQDLPNPFVGENEKKFDWVEEHKWRLKSTLLLSKEDFEKEFIELYFPSIDTYASIYVNGKLIAETENGFIPHSFQIKKYARIGENHIEVLFTPPVMYHQKAYEQMAFHYPAPNDVHKIAVAPHTRKPQYQFGWDWSLRMNTMGFNKPVQLFSYNNARLLNKSSNILSVNGDKAEVELTLFYSNPKLTKIRWGSKLFDEVIVKGKKGVFKRIVIIDKPELWWPRGQGKQFLYKDSAYIYSNENELINNVEVKFGIKTSELIQEKDEWGTSYYFLINGRPIFCKGADYIPQDIFPAKVKDEDLIKMVETMVESNFNMVRIWGGGYYPDEVFFDKCDELGIMVWEDFMFACAMYPDNKRFIKSITDEFNFQIPRIAGHASVVLFNGNNEVDVAWKNWGFQLQYKLFGKRALEIENAYAHVFQDLAPSFVKEYSTIPYIHTSPLSNWGKSDYYNHGSQHYWGVWHGKDPLEDFGKKIGRFNAEYGFQSFPEFNTLKSFADSTEWSLKSDVMKHHQKSYVGNGMIMKHAKKLYGNPSSFEEFVYFSQLTQAKAVSIAIAGHRVDAPRCGGTLYWQMNDCWPAPSWSSIDYYGNWKALQYNVKKDYRDIAIVVKYNDLEEKEYFLVSDFPEAINGVISYSVYSLIGEKIYSETATYDLAPRSSLKIGMSNEDLQNTLSANGLIQFSIDSLYKRSFDNIVTSYVKANERTVSYELVPSAVNSEMYLLTIKNEEFLRDLWVSSTQFGVKFDQNFDSLLPGEHVIKLISKKKITKDNIKLMWH